jgi:hypothetical protein
MVVQIVAKSLLILMNKGDMVNGERLTPEVERERAKITTWEEQTGSRLKHSAARAASYWLAVISDRQN